MITVLLVIALLVNGVLFATAVAELANARTKAEISGLLLATFSLGTALYLIAAEIAR